MKIIQYAIYICFCASVFLWHDALADQIPEAMVNSLQQREQRLSHLVFDWDVTLREAGPDLTSSHASAMKKSITKGYTKELERSNPPDKETVKADMQAAEDNVATEMKAFAYTSTNRWHFERDGETTLVSGDKKEGDFIASYRQFYSGTNGMLLNEQNRSTAGSIAAANDPCVWSSPGESIRYRTPFSSSLELWPEHFPFLLGLNPFAMYGAQWILISETPTSWLLDTQVDKGSFAHSRIRMTLSREHDNIPSQIVWTRGKQSATFQTLSYKRYGGDWIADKVVFSYHVPDFIDKNFTYTLASVKASGPITLTLPADEHVRDYRLIGTNLTGRAVKTADEQRKDDIIYYSWGGDFPSISELRQMQHLQNPGESLPDPDKSASLPLLGGIMALVGGVWMFKRRGNGGV